MTEQNSSVPELLRSGADFAQGCGCLLLLIGLAISLGRGLRLGVAGEVRGLTPPGSPVMGGGENETSQFLPLVWENYRSLRRARSMTACAFRKASLRQRRGLVRQSVRASSLGIRSYIPAARWPAR